MKNQNNKLILLLLCTEQTNKQNLASKKAENKNVTAQTLFQDKESFEEKKMYSPKETVQSFTAGNFHRNKLHFDITLKNITVVTGADIKNTMKYMGMILM